MSAQDRAVQPTPEDIEAALARQRSDLAASVDALAQRLSPATQAREAGQALGARTAEVMDSVEDRVHAVREQVEDRLHAAREAMRDTLERAQDGDTESIKVVAAVVGGVAAGAALLGLVIAGRAGR